jgi:glycosyltransferase involved in cell wall biosynthesis
MDRTNPHSVAVIIATFGGEDWLKKRDRAALSVEMQTKYPSEIIRFHGETLQEARNQAARLAMSDWLIFLDADDQLDKDYVRNMRHGSGDIRQPSTLGVVDGVEDDVPVLIPKRDLIEANYIVIGAMCRRDLFMEVGGFRDLPCLEDWDLWIRMVLAGAEVKPCPDAIYRVGVNPNSRNQNKTAHAKTYAEIRSKYRNEWRRKFGG